MFSNLESPEISFKKHDGKETAVRVISETLISDTGYFGDVFDTIIEIGGHQKRVIIKKYIGDEEEKRRCAKQALENYSSAKKAGLKVFPTFRISEDGKSILMTSGFLNDQICLGDNNLKNPAIEKIKDVDKFISSFFAEALKAAQKGIPLGADVPFIIVSKDKPTKIDFVLGDLDSLRVAEDLYDVWSYNIGNVKDELDGFCNHNINPNFRKKFLEKVDYYYKQALESIKDNKPK